MSVYLNDDTARPSCKSTLRFFKRFGDHSAVKKTARSRTTDADAERRRRALLAYMERRGHVRTTWAKAADVSESSLRWFLSGRTQSLNEETYRKLAEHDGVPIGLLRGDDTLPPRVPVRAYVGAGAEIFPFDGVESAVIDYADAPPGMDKSEAMVVRGTSMEPMYRDGDILFPSEPDTNPMRHIGSIVVLQLKDGRRLVKQILRGGKRDRWRLISVNPTVPALEDQLVAWVAPIPWVRRKL